MPITLITGPANAGTAHAVLEILGGHCARGAQPLLVVPTRADVDRCTRELADRGLAPAARTVRFDGLIAEVVRRAAEMPPPPLGKLARERLLATLAGRPTRGLTRALATFVAELRARRVDAAQLHDGLQEWARVEPAHSARARELAALYADYERVLAQLGRSDPEQRATAALDALRRAPARWHALPVALHGFDDLTALELDAIETLGAVVGAPLTVSLTFERGRTAFAGRAGTFQTLLALAAEHRELPARAAHYAPAARAALQRLECALFESEPGAPVQAGDAVRLLEGGGERAELELVAQEIRALLERGVPAREVALAHRAPATIADLLEEVLAAHAIPYALQRRVRFADSALGGALLGVLAAACEPDAELEQLLRWLRAPGMLADPEPLDLLEARARRAGIATAAEVTRALWSAAGLPPEPLLALERLRTAAHAGGIELIDCLGGELECIAAGTAAAFEELALQEPRIHAREQGALAAAREALAELRELAAAPAGAESSVAAWHAGLVPDAHALIATLRGLELTLAVDTAAAADGAADGGSDPGAERGVGSAPEAVAVLDPLALRTRNVRALFLCGLQEGVFPAPPRAEPLLSEDERRRLVESSGLLALADTRGVDALAAERYLFYAAVTQPRELLVLSWHTADDDGLARSRSLFVDDVCDLFASDLHGARRRRMLGEVGEGTVGLPGRHAHPVGGGAAPSPAPEPPQLLADRGGAPIAPLSDPRILGELDAGRLWSASALEAWAGCPVRWFVERLLRARELEPDPEPLARGALAHAALRDTLEALRRERGSARLSSAALPRARELLRAALDAREHEHPLSVAPERVPGVRRRLQVDLERYLEHAAAEESPLEPEHLELAFGFPEEPGSLPALELGEGVRVRGRIDRVDVDPDGRGSVVYDYKGAHAPDAARWTRARSFQVPLYMRALEQGLPGTDVVGGFYQPLSGRDLRARGVLARDAGIELDCVRGDAREREELDELLTDALAAAGAAAVEARAGALEGRPATCAFGERGCLYPTICRCES